ncbi:MAG TPA: MMPL family transporter, partial [Methanocella sp.]|nr:MMPL family transporter [Methanocella sp.]
ESDNQSSAKAFTNQLNHALTNDSAMKNMTQTTSIYGVQQQMLANMTPDMHANFVEAQDNITDASHQLYDGVDGIRNASDGLYYLYDNVTKMNSQFYDARRQIVSASSGLYSGRDQIVQGHDGLYQIKGAADMVLGVPTSFVQAYNSEDSSLDDANRSLAAYNMVAGSVSGTPASSYLDAFYHGWTSSSGDPMTRAQNAIRSSDVSGYIWAMPAEQQPLMLAIVNTFPLSVYPAGERDFCVNTAASMQGQDPSVKQQLYALYDLGPSPSSSVYDDMIISAAATKGGVDKSSIQDIYNLGRNPSDSTIGSYLTDKAITAMKNSDAGKNMSVADMQNATDMIHDAWNLGGMATEQDFDKYVLDKAGNGMNASEKQSIKDIWAMGKNPNDTVIDNYVLEQAAKNGSMNQSELDDARELIALGKNPSNTTIQAYLVNKTMKSLNITGDSSYFLAVMNLDRNATNESLSQFGTEWAETHDTNNPDLLPHQLASNLVSGNVSLYVVSFDADGARDSVLLDGDLTELRNKIAEVKGKGDFGGINVYVTGNAPILTDTKTASLDDMSHIDMYTIAIVLILLLIYFRSFLTPFVPLISIVVALIASMGAVALVGHFIGLYYILEELMVVIMLGAGIDYCVFMLSRYAEERREGKDVKTAVVMTVQHAGKSIASSGMTAALGFAALVLSGQGLFISMGIGVAIGLTISMLSALTLIPSILTLIGDRIFWPNKIYMVKSSATFTGLWTRLSSGVIKHSKVIVVLALLLAIPAVYFAAQVTTSSDTISMLPNNVESKQGFDVLKNSMGSGAMDRAMITVTLPENLTDSSGNRSVSAMDKIERISAMVTGIQDVNTVYSMTRPDGTTINYQNLSVYSAIEKGYYENYMDNSTGLDDRTTVIYASFNGSPYSNDAFVAVDQMRTVLQDNSSGALQGTVVHVGGQTANTHEMAKANVNGFLVVLPIVIGGIMLILLVLLRSAVLPIRIILTLSLSIMVTLAGFVLVYQIGQGESMIFMLPMLFFCALMGMGVDYDIFLVTRVEEELKSGKNLKDAISKAISSTGTIILICALVMAGTFGSLILSSMQIMSQLGFILTAGILIQGILMILVVVPAIKTLLGKWNWWMPGKKEPARAPEIAASQQEQKVEK